jgi:hypothetical protein
LLEEWQVILPVVTALRMELATARSRVSGLTFDQAHELFKAIESIKVRIRHAGGKYRWLARA